MHPSFAINTSTQHGLCGPLPLNQPGIVKKFQMRKQQQVIISSSSHNSVEHRQRNRSHHTLSRNVDSNLELVTFEHSGMK